MNRVLNWIFGSFFRTLGRVLVYILIGFLLCYLFKDLKLPNLFTVLDVSADVSVAGTTLNPSAWTYVVGNRNVTIVYEDDILYPTIADIPKYFAITFCSDTAKIQSWYTNAISSTATKATDVSIYKTNIPCSYPNSDYAGGRVLYITGTNGYSSSVSGTNALIYNSITYYQPSDTSVVLLSATMTNEPISIDYATDTLISQNQSIIEQNQQIINGQNNINNNISNSDSSQATNDASSFFSSFSTNTHGLTGIITAPLNAIQSLSSQTCSPLVLPLPFINEDLTLPCMRSIYTQYFGDFMTLYDIITLGIISYWVMVRIFGLVKDFKNPEHDEIEVLDL